MRVSVEKKKKYIKELLYAALLYPLLELKDWRRISLCETVCLRGARDAEL